MGRSLDKIEKQQPLEDRVYIQLKRVILNGTLAPGVVTTETELAEELGVSRTPVRKALARLEQEGFITNISPKGYQIAELSLKEICDIYELREILECHILHEVTQRLTSKDLADMESALQAGDRCFAEEDYFGGLDHYRVFHHILDRKYGNERISSILDSLDERLYHFWIARLKSGSTENILNAFRQHHPILQALRDGNVESAVAITREHLRWYVGVENQNP